MTCAMGNKVVLAGLAVAIGLTVLGTSPLSIGQENAEKVEKRVRGRLPAYYPEIVTGEQREKIYEIQSKYQEQITELTQQLTDLVKQQNDEIENVLTEEQKVQLKKAQAEGVAKKKKKAMDKKAAKAGAGGRATATP
jgi:hypothetical protein